MPRKTEGLDPEYEIELEEGRTSISRLEGELEFDGRDGSQLELLHVFEDSEGDEIVLSMGALSRCGTMLEPILQSAGLDVTEETLLFRGNPDLLTNEHEDVIFTGDPEEIRVAVNHNDSGISVTLDTDEGNPNNQVHIRLKDGNVTVSNLSKEGSTYVRVIQSTPIARTSVTREVAPETKDWLSSNPFCVTGFAGDES